MTNDRLNTVRHRMLYIAVLIMETVGVKGLIRCGDQCDQRDQPIVFDAVRVTLDCMSEIMCILNHCPEWDK